MIKLKAPPLSLFEGETNDRIVMRLQPHAHLDVRIDVKSPGLNDDVEEATLTHRYPDWLGVDGYEKLLFDSINGDQSHFVHSEEVIESWRIVDDLLCTGDNVSNSQLLMSLTFTKKAFGDYPVHFVYYVTMRK